MQLLCSLCPSHRLYNRFCMLLLAGAMLCASPARASLGTQEDEALLQNFTRSMVVMFVAAQMCKDTLKKHDVEIYSAVIRDYLTQYYPKGIGYWVLPSVTGREASKVKCKTMLEERLMYYESASKEFIYLYPDEPTPPILASVFSAKPRPGFEGVQPVKGRILPAVVAPTKF
jgi:hypothetical protein